MAFAHWWGSEARTTGCHQLFDPSVRLPPPHSVGQLRSQRTAPPGACYRSGLPDPALVAISAADLEPHRRAGIDADILIKVSSFPADTDFCKTSIAAAMPVVYETLTRRAIFGQIWMCQVFPDNDFSSNLAHVLHELTHIVV